MERISRLFDLSHLNEMHIYQKNHCEIYIH